MLILMISMCDKQAVAWNWKTASWLLSGACLAAKGRHNHRAAWTTCLRRHFEMTLRLQQNISRYESVMPGHTRPSVNFSGDVIFSEHSASACCLAALSGHISQHRTSSHYMNLSRGYKSDTGDRSSLQDVNGYYLKTAWWLYTAQFLMTTVCYSCALQRCNLAFYGTQAYSAWKIMN